MKENLPRTKSHINCKYATSLLSFQNDEDNHDNYLFYDYKVLPRDIPALNYKSIEETRMWAYCPLPWISLYWQCSYHMSLV